MTATVIDGRGIAARMMAEVAAEAAALAESGWAPRLAWRARSTFARSSRAWRLALARSAASNGSA